LTGPKWVQTLVQTTVALLSHDLAPALAQATGERRQRGLHADLDGLERTKEDIGDELSSRRSSQVHDGLVHSREQLLAVVVLEDLVRAVLARTLERVSDEGWRPTEENTANTLGARDLGPGLDVGAVDLGVDLTTAFYEIQRGDGCVSWTASNDTTKSASCEVGAREKLNLLLRSYSAGRFGFVLRHLERRVR